MILHKVVVKYVLQNLKLSDTLTHFCNYRPFDSNELTLQSVLTEMHAEAAYATANCLEPY